MRLLQLLGNGELNLTKDLRNGLPRYAILSHTWGEDEDELTITDIQNRVGREKLGYSKAIFCAQQAKADDIGYFWIDTCCIDKSNSTELAEAINSMHAWYSQAEKCYVYLSDVSCRKRNFEGQSDGLWRPAFRRSRWFTRGWTLQELLAPKTVEFFSRESQYLGDKLALAELLNDITSIPLAALQGSPMAAFSVEERLRWVKFRETSRVEDKAYCLLGIFDIFLSPIYGEKLYAMQRLMRKIHKQHVSIPRNGHLPAQSPPHDPTGHSHRLYDKVSRWLSPPDPISNHDEACRRHEPGTGQWLLQTEQYLRWKTLDSTGLCVNGKAGCGKSILCATVIEDARRQCQADPNAVLMFFYFSFSDHQKQDYGGFLRSIILQICQNEAILEGLSRILAASYWRDPSVTALERILSAALEFQPYRFILIVDALDEIPADSQRREDVLRWLERVMNGKHRLKVFLTSRPLPEVTNLLASIDAPMISALPELVNVDIENHVKSELSSHLKLRALDANVKANICDTLVRRANGMFRWAVCQLDELKVLKSSRPSYVNQVLNKLPSTLDGMYDRMLGQIDDLYFKEALAALKWLAFETRPLTLNELSEACLIDLSEGNVRYEDRGDINDILDILSSLVILEAPAWTVHKASLKRKLPESAKSESRVRLAHFSVKEYLTSGRIADSKVSRYALGEPQDQNVIGQSCALYLLEYSRSSAKTGSIGDLHRFPLLYYSASSWMKHCSRAQKNDLMHDVDLLENAALRVNWLAIHDPDHPWRQPFSTKLAELAEPPAIYYASLGGAISTVERLLLRGANVNALGGSLGTAVKAATFSGHTHVVKFLVAHRASLDIQDGIDGTALNLAVVRRNMEIAKVLISAGADVDVGVIANPLMTAVYWGEIEFATLLLEAGAYANVVDTEGNCLLQEAINSGNTELSKLLILNGADVDSDCDQFGNALHAAIYLGNIELATFLLDRGASPYAERGNYGSALYIASLAGYATLVERMLPLCSDIDSPQGFSGTLLQAASYGGHMDVALLLLERGADVNTKGGQYCTALQAASDLGHIAIVDMLLRRGADPNIEGGFHGSALAAAAHCDDAEVMRRLIEGGAK